MRKARRRRRRSRNYRPIIAAVIVLLLVIATAVTIKVRYFGKNTDKTAVEETENTGKEKGDKKPVKVENPEPIEEVSSEELEAERSADAEEQLATFLPDFDSEPLLNTTPIKYLTMQPGGEQGSIRFNWFQQNGSKGQVVLYNCQTGDAEILDASTNASATEPGYFYCKAHFEGLAPNTTYAYHVGNDAGGWSPEYKFRTPDYDAEKTTFIVFSDAEMGQAETEDLTATVNRFDAVMTRLVNYYPEAAFAISLGDQVAGYNEPSHYSAYFEHLAMYKLPIANVVGNHDVDCWDSGGGPWFYERYNVPNRSALGCNWADTDGDYWFTYGDILFIVLNTESLYEAEQHESFVGQAVGANPNARWKIICTHKPAFSSRKKYQEQGERMRASLAYINDYYDIDLVLSGHDGLYTRTYFMKWDEGTGDQNYKSGGTGTLSPELLEHITVGSSSGSLYQEADKNYAAAVQKSPDAPMAMIVEETYDSLHMTCYQVDTWEVLDEYTLTK